METLVGRSGAGLPDGSVGRICLQCRRLRRPRFHPWVRTIPPEKEMATHASILARRIPRTEEPGGLQSRGVPRVRHD